VVLEKNRRAGVKILMSGGTRCNITNARGLHRLETVSGPIDPAFNPALCRGNRAIQDAFAGGGSFLGPALRRFDVDQTIRLFETEGIATKIEGNGKIFPVSDRAVDVLAALLRRLEQSGAALRCQSSAGTIERCGNEQECSSGFVVSTSSGTLSTRSVILAVGGKSYPGCGTTGDGYTIANSFGHTIVEPRPALVPIRVDANWVTALRGLSLADVSASVRSSKGLTLQERREAILFTHFGLSGPAILDISRSVTRHDEPETLQLKLDFFPELRREELDEKLQKACRQGRAALVSILAGELPHRLSECLVAGAQIPLDRLGPDLSRVERNRLIAMLKALSLPIQGTLGFEKAEVTSGGIALDEVDPRTLESRLVPNLYLVGEILDLDGLIGGYNFQAAWSTGWLAGEMAAQDLPRPGP
jgi:predicted Rossmann fold flavoprotein